MTMIFRVQISRELNENERENLLHSLVTQLEDVNGGDAKYIWTVRDSMDEVVEKKRDGWFIL